MRNTFRYASKAHWYELARELRLVYTAATEQAARERFDEFAGDSGTVWRQSTSPHSQRNMTSGTSEYV